MKPSTAARSVAPLSLPSPADLGLAPKYEEWRQQQIDGIQYVRESKKRVKGLMAPTGVGKTACALALAVLKIRSKPGARVLILTETKGLQKVYADEGRQMRGVTVANISGANNYDCRELLPGGRFDYFTGSRRCDNGPCNAGMQCRLRDRGCTYYGSDGALQIAKSAQIVITNYANWFAAADASLKEEKFGDFDLIICDEGHSAADSLCSALAVELDLRDVAHLKSPTSVSQDIDQWRKWAAQLLPLVECELSDYAAELKSSKTSGIRPSPLLLADIKRMQRVSRSVLRVATMRGDWVTVVDGGTKVQFKPVWPDRYCESHFLRGIPDVVLMSATLVPQALRNIGLRDFDFMEMESTFPVERRPIYLWPVARMRWNMDSAEEQKMLDGLDVLLQRRPKWRWLVHTVSYGRAKLIASRSKQRMRMVDHLPSATIDTVEWLKKHSPEDAVVLTPAMHTGVDLPDDSCRGQAFVKIPFPDTRDPVTKARIAKDKNFLYYAASTYIVQAVGRPNRHEEDWSENWFLDSNALWFFKTAAELGFIPKGTMAAVKKVSGIGRAPKW